MYKYLSIHNTTSNLFYYFYYLICAKQIDRYTHEYKLKNLIKSKKYSLRFQLKT